MSGARATLYSYDVRTGRDLLELPASAGTWSIETNADGGITATIPGDSPDAIKSAVWARSSIAKRGLLAVVDDEPVAAGPIWSRSYRQAQPMELSAGGSLWSYFSRRILLPPAARSRSLFLSNGAPDPSLDTRLSGLSLGGIARRWVELVQAWPDGSVPIKLPEEELGGNVRNVAALDLADLRSLLENLTKVDGGPDIMFRPRWNSDRAGIYHEMIVGTAAQPRIGSTDPSRVQWSIGGAANGGAYDLGIDEDAANLGSEVWLTAGESDDDGISAHNYNPLLIEDGYPLMQMSDGSHSSVRRPSTLASYARQATQLGRYTASSWSLTVRAHEPGAPRLGAYWVGDLARITIDEDEPVFPPGSYVRRIARIAGNIESEDYSIDFVEKLTWQL